MPSLPSGAPAPRPGGGTGPLRNGNPRGNPNLAPRCGAKARSGNPCRAPAMANGRCRIHGGKCTGPRTPEGMARMIAAHTTHGDCGAAKRAIQRDVRTLATRTRLFCAAVRLRAYLPAEMAARLALGPAELRAPDHPTQVAFLKNADPMPCNVRNGGEGTRRGAAARRAGRAARLALRVRDVERRAALAEADGQAPWRQAIAFARAAKRAARITRSDAMKPEAERLVRAAPPSPASLRDATLVRSSRPKPAGPARCALHTARSNTTKREDRRDCPGLGNDGGRQGAECATPRIKGPGARLFRPTLPRQALVCTARPKPEAPDRCTLHTARSNPMRSLPTLEPATGHLTRWGACPGGEKGRVPGLTRLNPTKAVALHSQTPARTREPSVFETLAALSGCAVPQASPRQEAAGGGGARSRDAGRGCRFPARTGGPPAARWRRPRPGR
jgi:hypothetical protein